ncbi:Tim44 domain-containing protein [Undibacterium arcticum]
MIAATSLSLMVGDAAARRLGGGSSIGRQSQTVSRQATAPAPTQTSKTAAPAAAPSAAPATAAATAPVAPKPASAWKGMLGGALLGLGAGALLSHFGMGGAMGGMLGSLLMIALLGVAAMFVVRMFRNKASAASPMAPAFGGEGYAPFSTPEIGSRIEPPVQPSALQAIPSQATPSLATPSAAAAATAVTTAAAPWGVPADFDTAGFLRTAKTYFIRLQAAWDKADNNDIREFTTPEMYAELKLQVQERGATPNNTDVVSLNADLLGLETVGSDHLASVKFSGMIKESAEAAAEPFAEVWNLTKPMSGQGGWLLAGIQQLS